MRSLKPDAFTVANSPCQVSALAGCLLAGLHENNDVTSRSGNMTTEQMMLRDCVLWDSFSVPVYQTELARLSSPPSSF